MRNLGLDLLRFIAVFLVLGRHIPLPGNPSLVLSAWHRGGWVGVDLFFVLSGFLVSGLLFREHRKNGSINIKRFLIRRGLKIYPAFWVMIFFTIFVVTIRNQGLPAQRILSELFFIQNYFDGLWNHTWSLAVEEHFYFGIAFLFVSLLAFRPINSFSIIPKLFLFIAVICFLFRLLTLWVFPVYSYRWYLFGTHIRIDSLFFGVLLSYLHHCEPKIEIIRTIPVSALIAGGLLFLLPAFLFPLEQYRWISVVGVILFYLGSGFFLLGAIRLESSTNRFLLFLGAMGSASYSIYLWHMPMNVWGMELVQKATGHHSFFFYLCAYIAGSIVFGFFMSKLVEWPLLRIRDKLFPS